MSGSLRTWALAATLAAGSCVAGPGGAETDRAAGGSGPITREEIDRGQWRDAYELVRSLRPSWLWDRGPDSFENPGQIQVYVDGTRLGEVRLLRTLSTQGIERVEWIDAVSAAGRWGLNHAHGVIYITYGRVDPGDPAPDAEPDTSHCNACQHR